MLRIDAETDDRQAIFTVAGTLDVESAPELTEQVQRAIAAGAEKVVFDCADLDFLDSSGINVLIRAWDSMRGRATIPVVVANPNENVLRVLDICGMTQILLIE